MMLDSKPLISIIWFSFCVFFCVVFLLLSSSMLLLPREQAEAALQKRFYIIKMSFHPTFQTFLYLPGATKNVVYLVNVRISTHPVCIMSTR